MAQQTDLFEFKDENARFGIKDEWMNKPLHIGGQKQQTAVGWLIMQLPVKIRVELYEKNIHEQALQMEKEQIINAFFMGRDEITKKFVESEEQYYNEKYGENKD